MDLLIFTNESILRVPDFTNVLVVAQTCSIIFDNAFEIITYDNETLQNVHTKIINTLHSYAGQRRVKIDLQGYNIESAHEL